MKHFVCTIITLGILAVAASSCRVARHIPQGEAVVSRVEVRIDGQASSASDLRMATVQKPYHRTFGFLPMGVWMWHPDTTTFWHRMRGRLGTAPPIYNEESARRTERALQVVMQRKGFLDAEVSHRTIVENQKARVIYNISSNRPRRLAAIRYMVQDTTLNSSILVGSEQGQLHVGDLLDHSALENERQRITTMMRERGYWSFNKENISYIADTLKGKEEVDLTIRIDGEHQQWRFRKVHFLANFNILSQTGTDSLTQHFRQLDQPGYDLTYSGEQCYLRDPILLRSCEVIPGELYSESAIRNTYAALSRLHILRYVNLRVESVSEEGEEPALDCFVYLSPQSNHAIQFEVDGTNTAGDLGFALALSYQHRNLFRGSEAFTTRLKGGYESLTGNVENLVNKNYSEYAAEFGLDIPRFLFPFLSEEVKRKSRASSLFKASFSHQSRPEYTRIITQGAFGYKWNSPSAHHTWDILNLSYVHLPEQSETFKQLIENLGPISYSSYSSHFILGMNYTLYLGNNTLTTGRQQRTTKTLWSLRINPEIAGNVLSGFSNMFNAREEDGRYKIVAQPFEQYARLDVDWSSSLFLSERSRLALRAAGGVAVPYGNSDVMPFEKRYYSGGANSVRGWSVRELGPGRYKSADAKKFNFFNQCGDVRLDTSVELRTDLFWKFESAIFVDAGNVWTIKPYDNQVGGEITSDFYKQIAASWGVGLRVVTDFVILRLDWGFKAHDPSIDADERWAIRHPFRSNHNTVHFAVGYPF